MKVKELIEKLGDYDPELEVVIWDDVEGDYWKLDRLKKTKCVNSDSYGYRYFYSEIDEESEAILVVDLKHY